MSWNPPFRETLEKRLKAMRIRAEFTGAGWKWYDCRDILDTSTAAVQESPSVKMGLDLPYGGIASNASQLELMACLSNEWQIPEGEDTPCNYDIEWRPASVRALGTR